MRQGKVFVNGIFAGILTEESQHKFIFEYDSEYMTSPAARSVCLSMPVSVQRYESDTLFPFFSNMLSEGENRKMQARYHRLDEHDDFGILLATASYDTIGCVTVKPIDLK